MKVKDLLPHSCFATIATIKDFSCIQKLEKFLSYNLPFINSFSNKILSINFTSTATDVVESYIKMWKDNVPGLVVLVSSENRGHMFGTIDLEEAILKHVKENLPEVKYLFKSMDDVITSELLLETNIEEADFYYLPGFSTDSIRIAGSKEKLYTVYENFEYGLWTPQTTFFILDITSVDTIYGNDVNSKFDIYQDRKKTNPSIKPWEIPFDIKFDCETHLGRTTKDLKKFCILHQEFKTLLEFGDSVGIWDPSHKNFYFKRIGVCHYHYHDQPVYEF